LWEPGPWRKVFGHGIVNLHLSPPDHLGQQRGRKNLGRRTNLKHRIATSAGEPPGPAFPADTTRMLPAWIRPTIIPKSTFGSSRSFKIRLTSASDKSSGDLGVWPKDDFNEIRKKLIAMAPTQNRFRVNMLILRIFMGSGAA